MGFLDRLFGQQIDERLVDEIGQELYDKGGMKPMRRVYQRVYHKGQLTSRYLDHAWDRIGEWRH